MTPPNICDLFYRQTEDVVNKLLASPIGLQSLMSLGGPAALSDGSLTSSLSDIFCQTLKSTETQLIASIASGDYHVFIGSGLSIVIHIIFCHFTSYYTKTGYPLYTLAQDLLMVFLTWMVSIRQKERQPTKARRSSTNG